jgi:hypothetical protein
MRLMLGTKERPSLLVNVKQEHGPDHFDFWVVNGNWDGTYTDGYVTVWGCPSGDYSSLDKIEILCDDQDRLRSSDWSRGYEDVFVNFNNPDYVAPKPKKVEYPASWDDDIPF